MVALSLAPDVDQIADAGLITADWTDAARQGHGLELGRGLRRASRATRWASRTGTTSQPGVEILTPDPASSGGARWNLVSLWGAALRGYAGRDEGRHGRCDDADAGRARQRDRCSTRARATRSRTSRRGNGDVAITYENEVLHCAGRRARGRGRLPAVDGADREPGRDRGRERRRALRRVTSRRRSSSTCTRRRPRRSTPTSASCARPTRRRPRQGGGEGSRRSRTCSRSTRSAAGTR